MCNLIPFQLRSCKGTLRHHLFVGVVYVWFVGMKPSLNRPAGTNRQAGAGAYMAALPSYTDHSDGSTCDYVPTVRGKRKRMQDEPAVVDRVTLGWNHSGMVHLRENITAVLDSTNAETKPAPRLTSDFSGARGAVGRGSSQKWTPSLTSDRGDRVNRTPCQHHLWSHNPTHWNKEPPYWVDEQQKYMEYTLGRTLRLAHS
jgi:hypothetical protein